MNETTKLKAIHMIVNSRDSVDQTKVELIRGLVETSPYAETTRIDPPGCGCTDCITGWSKPAETNSEYDLYQYIAKIEAKR